MKKLLIASASAIAVLGLAACTDADDTTTQAVPPAEDGMAPVDPGAAPAPAPTETPPAPPMD